MKYIAVAGIGYFVLLGLSFFLNAIPISKSGPSSPEGYKVKIEISDHQLFSKWITAGLIFDNPGSDYYHKVRLFDGSGNILCSVDGIDGGGEMSSTAKIVKSMRWVSKDEFDFIGDGDRYVFKRGPVKKWLIKKKW